MLGTTTGPTENLAPPTHQQPCSVNSQRRSAHRNLVVALRVGWGVLRGLIMQKTTAHACWSMHGLTSEYTRRCVQLECPAATTSDNVAMEPCILECYHGTTSNEGDRLNCIR